MRGAALHDVLYAFFLSCQTNFFHFTLKSCFTFPAKLYIINTENTKASFSAVYAIATTVKLYF